MRNQRETNGKGGFLFSSFLRSVWKNGIFERHAFIQIKALAHYSILEVEFISS